MLTRTDPQPQPRYRAEYRNCDSCGWQFIPPTPEDRNCNLCVTSIHMPDVTRSLRRSSTARYCEVCSAEFPSGTNALTCSPECHEIRTKEYQKARYADRSDKECKGCGDIFTPKHGLETYCSEKCRLFHQQKRQGERRKLARMMAAADERRTG